MLSTTINLSGSNFTGHTRRSHCFNIITFKIFIFIQRIEYCAQQALWAKSMLNCFENLLSVVTMSLILLQHMVSLNGSFQIYWRNSMLSICVWLCTITFGGYVEVMFWNVSLLNVILFLHEKGKIFPELPNFNWLNDLVFL